MSQPRADTRRDTAGGASTQATRGPQPTSPSHPPPRLAQPNAKGAAAHGSQLGLCDVYDLQGQPDPAGEVAYFMSIPWCRAHLQPAEGRPPGSAAGQVIRIAQPDSRRKGKPTPAADGSVISSTKTQDNAFSTTLHTLDTIGAFIVFYEDPPPPLSISNNNPEYRSPILELKALMYLGPGLNGHVGVAHGGLVTTILDEVLGLLIPLNRQRAKHNQRVGATPPLPLPSSASPLGAEAAAAASATVNKGFVTGYLNTTYVRPVYTCASVLVTARFTRMEGTRKFYIEGAVWDDKSQVLAKAESVFIALKERL